MKLNWYFLLPRPLKKTTTGNNEENRRPEMEQKNVTHSVQPSQEKSEVETTTTTTMSTPQSSRLSSDPIVAFSVTFPPRPTSTLPPPPPPTPTTFLPRRFTTARPTSRTSLSTTTTSSRPFKFNKPAINNLVAGIPAAPFATGSRFRQSLTCQYLSFFSLKLSHPKWIKIFQTRKKGKRERNSNWSSRMPGPGGPPGNGRENEIKRRTRQAGRP